jgi:hypothetical protein
MGKLHLVVNDASSMRNPDTLRLLQDAAVKLGIECQVVEASKSTYATGEPLKLEPGSMLYRLGIDRASALLEYLLIGPGVATFYKDIGSLYARRFGWSSDVALSKADLPIVPTVYLIHRPNQEELTGMVSKLGGFPVVVKGSGGSHGASVRLASSDQELDQALDELIKRSAAEVVLKQYLPSARHIRCIVIGGQAVDFIEYIKPENDFRTNAVDTPQVVPFERSDELAKLAVEAAVTASLDFAGVDILVQDGHPFVAELNFPCNFARNQLTTGTDVASMMIDFLHGKIATSL